MKQCLECGNNFRLKLHYKFKKFCSSKCAVKNWQERNKERFKEQKRKYYQSTYIPKITLHHKVKGLHLWEK